MTVLDENARGVFPVAPTPSLPDGALDWSSVDRLDAAARAEADPRLRRLARTNGRAEMPAFSVTGGGPRR